MRLSHAICVFLSLAGSDVMPSCGKREPQVAKPGDACGGPYVCTAPSTCATLDQSIHTSSYSTPYICTKACASNADCTDLGLPMICGATGTLHGSGQAGERVCIPMAAQMDGDR